MKLNKKCLGEFLILSIACFFIVIPLFSSCGGGGGGSTTTVTNGNTVIPLDGGGSIEFKEGSIPEGTQVVVQSTRTPVLPEGVTPVGGALSIKVDSTLTWPATLRLPIPQGVSDPSDLAIIRVEGNGTSTILETWVEGSKLVAMTPGFSNFSIVKLGQDLLNKSNEEQKIIWGNSFLAPGERHTYYVDSDNNFYCGGHLNTCKGSWDAFGAAEVIKQRGLAAIFEAAGETGEGAIITFTFTNPPTGTRWYGTKNIEVRELSLPADELDVELTTVTREIYSGDLAEFEARVIEGGAPPISWTWDYGDRTWRGKEKNDSLTYILPRKKYDLRGSYFEQYRVEVRATDSNGSYGYAFVLVKVYPPHIEVFIDGPAKLTLSDQNKAEGKYVVSAAGGNPWYTVELMQIPRYPDPTHSIVIYEEGYRWVSEFQEPGVHHITATVKDKNNRSGSTTYPVTVEGGIPLSVALQGLPSSAEVGEFVKVNIQIMGGVLLVSGKKRGYTLELDWEDGKVQEVKGVGVTSNYQDGVPIVMSHTYSKPGTYTLTATVFDATGNHDDDSNSITVSDSKITFPVTYKGPGDFSQTRRVDWGLQDDETCNSSPAWSITLYDDGTLEAEVKITRWAQTTNDGEVYCIDAPNTPAAKKLGNHSNGYFSIDMSGNEIDLSDNKLTGTYDSNHIVCESWSAEYDQLSEGGEEIEGTVNTKESHTFDLPKPN